MFIEIKKHNQKLCIVQKVFFLCKHKGTKNAKISIANQFYFRHYLKPFKHMKRIKLTFLMSVLSVCSMMALPYQTANRDALFLTDKMAYELNLSYDQYDYVYQVNLDYFLNINSAYDCTGKQLNSLCKSCISAV